MFGVLALFPERGMGIQQMNVEICLYLWFLALAVPNALSGVILTQMRIDLLSSLLIKMIEENTKGKKKIKASVAYQHDRLLTSLYVVFLNLHLI